MILWHSTLQEDIVVHLATEEGRELHWRNRRMILWHSTQQEDIVVHVATEGGVVHGREGMR